jgi:PleD family two-component response regulator
MGIACSTLFPTTELSVCGMVTAADDALYQAKHEGRDRVCAASAAACPRET